MSIFEIRIKKMKPVTIKAYTNDASQIEAIKAFMKALKIEFELSKESTYNREFVEKIKKGDQDLKNGKGTTVTLEDLENLWK